MLGNVWNAAPAAVPPLSRCKSFVHERAYPPIKHEYKNWWRCGTSSTRGGAAAGWWRRSVAAARSRCRPPIYPLARDSQPLTAAPFLSGPCRASTSNEPHLEGPLAKGFVAITVERCKGCGFCVEFCPTHVLALSSAFNSTGYHPPHVVDAEKCSGCDLCGMYCPDFAIFGARYAR
jgi:2-oxoglutarate ferredoxin oxidoreductase subunit delta